MYIKVLLVCSQHRGYKEGQIAESFGKITTSLPESGNHLPTIAWSNPDACMAWNILNLNVIWMPEDASRAELRQPLGKKD